MQAEHELALREIRAEQARLHRGVQRMDDRIHALTLSLESATPEAEPEDPSSNPKAEPVPAELTPAPAPPPDATPPVSQPLPAFAPISFKRSPTAPVPAANPGNQSDSIEMALGRVWLARIGIVILLTGLVFLGNLAYQHIVPLLGPGAKLSILLGAGVVLSGVGIMLGRNRESLRNYGRVVLAGGCATIYYAAYAAYFVAPLKVIENPIFAGALLLGLAIAIGAAANRLKSETLALIAVVLSFYTSALNPIGHFTLFSSLLMAGTALFFLLRHRWVRLAAASIAGAYLSYVWCRFFGGAEVLPGAEKLTTVAFLAGYWLLFTTAGFLASREAMGAAARVQILTLNNAAFGVLGALEVMAHRPAEAWIFSLGYGVVLLCLGRVARHRVPDGGLVDGAYSLQGMALTTLGMALKLTGQQLTLALAAQSVALLAGSGRPPLLRLGSSMLSAAGAVALAAGSLWAARENAPAVAGFVMIAMTANIWVLRKRLAASPDHSLPLPILLAGAAVILCEGALWRGTNWPQMTGWMALAAVVGAVIPRRAGLRELSLASQVLLPVASVLWTAAHLLPMGGSRIAITQPVVLLLAGAALSIWWARQPWTRLRPDVRAILESTPAFSAAAVAVCWTFAAFPAREILVAASLLGAGWIGTAVWLRARFLTLAGFAFTFLTIVEFARFQGSAHWAVALLPIGHLLFIAGMGRFAPRLGAQAREFASAVTNFAIGIAGVMSVFWIFAHIPREWQALFFAILAAVSAIGGAFAREKSLSFAAAGLGAFAWLLAVVFYQSAPNWQHLTAIVLFPAASRVARSIWKDEPTAEAAPAITWGCMVGITLWAHRWCELHAHQMSLTVMWTLLALLFFSAGMLLRDRHYRLGGLGLLGLSVGRVFFVDVWAFDPVFRIISFIVLGTVLLLVGYCYNRFEEKLRRWL